MGVSEKDNAPFIVPAPAIRHGAHLCAFSSIAEDSDADQARGGKGGKVPKRNARWLSKFLMFFIKAVSFKCLPCSRGNQHFRLACHWIQLGSHITLGGGFHISQISQESL